MRTLVALSLVLLVAHPALAQRAPAPAPQLGESAQNMLGSWEFSNAERNKICTATFKNTRTAVGLRIEFDPNCAGLFPLVSAVAGWVFPDGDLLRLVEFERGDGRRIQRGRGRNLRSTHARRRRALSTERRGCGAQARSEPRAGTRRRSRRALS